MDKEDFKGKGWGGENKYKEQTSRRKCNVGGGKMENDMLVLRLIWLLMQKYHLGAKAVVEKAYQLEIWGILLTVS